MSETSSTSKQVEALTEQLSGVHLNASLQGKERLHRKIHVAKPTPFSGQRKDFKSFLKSLRLYLLAANDELVTNNDKIIFTLSFMTEGLAGLWADNYLEECNMVITDEWETFLTKLKETFDDPYEKANAQEKLNNITQGKKTAEEFFQEFDLLIRAAKYHENHDEYLISILREKVNSKVVMKITEMVDEPENYHTWKRMAIKIDRKLHLANSIVAKPISLPKPPIIPKQSNPTLEKRDGTGVTFGGRGQPMDLSIDRARRNGLCYLCGLKGHLARNCPQRKTQIRSILMCMEPEERQAWADEVDCLKESELAEVEQDFGQA